MKISIVTACYNSVGTLGDTLRTIQMQTHKDIEHIVIDGGSTDGTLELLEKNRQHIAYLTSEPDKGLYDAMNKGIAKATGDVIGLLNSDDLFANENVLSRVAQALSDESVDACYGDLVYVAQDDIQKIMRYWKSCDYNPALLAKGFVPAHPTFYVRKKVHDMYGIYFNTNYKLAADYEVLLRLLFTHKINVAYIPDVMIKMRLGGTTNKSFQNIINQNKEILHALKRHQCPVAWPSFMMHKVIDRVKQYANRGAYVG